MPPKPDPWGGVLATSPPPQPPKQDPWSPTSQSSTDLDDFDLITNRNRTSPKSTTTNGTNGGTTDPFELNLLGDALPPSSALSPSTGATKKTPQSFLGENSALVNLDNLVTTSKPANAPAANPFSEGQPPQRPVFNTPAPKPTINEMKQASFAQFTTPSTGFAAGAPVQDPWTPAPSNSQLGAPWMKSGEQANPFLS